MNFLFISFGGPGGIPRFARPGLAAKAPYGRFGRRSASPTARFSSHPCKYLLRFLTFFLTKKMNFLFISFGGPGGIPRFARPGLAAKAPYGRFGRRSASPTARFSSNPCK